MSKKTPPTRSVRDEARDIRTVLREEGYEPALPPAVVQQLLTRLNVPAPTWVGRAEISLRDVAIRLIGGGYTAESLYAELGELKVRAA